MNKARKLIAQALHDINHVNDKQMDSNRSQYMLLEADKKLKKARQIIKQHIQD